MKLYFLRHGKADWPDWDRPDDERPLTSKGKKEMRRVATLLHELEVAPALILSSPLPRALQTAEIAAEALGIELKQEAELKPGFRSNKLRSILKRHGDQDLMIVGHEPDFSMAITHLTGGRIKLAKGGIARIDLDHPSGEGRLVWLVPPAASKR